MLESPLIKVMTDAVRMAARPMIRDFGESEHLRYSVKGNEDYVTQTDLRSEKTLCEQLSIARPTYSILSEECGFLPAAKKDITEYQWVIDPLDGTRNFIHGFPYFAISVAVKSKNEIMAGMIYAPISNELFFAEKGRGAFLNGKRMRVSTCTHLSKSLLGYSHLGANRDKFIEIMRQGAHTRQLGSTALGLAWVADARFDGFVVGESALWDVAAAVVILQEAGALLSQPDGSPLDLNMDKIALCAAGPKLHRLLTQ